MIAERYIEVKVGVFEDKIFPYNELTFVEDDYFGNHYKFPDASHSEKIHKLTTMVWDLKKKCFKPTTVLSYNNPSADKYQIGKNYLIETKHGHYKIDELVDIKFESYDTSFKKFKDVDDWEKKYIGEIPPLDKNEIVEIRTNKPTFVFKNGKETEWEHEINFLDED